MQQMDRQRILELHSKLHRAPQQVQQDIVHESRSEKHALAGRKPQIRHLLGEPLPLPYLAPAQHKQYRSTAVQTSHNYLPLIRQFHEELQRTRAAGKPQDQHQRSLSVYSVLITVSLLVSIIYIYTTG